MVKEAIAQVTKHIGHLRLIAKASGLSYSWVNKFGRGEITNPTINSLQAIKDACKSVRRHGSKV
jgi:hypothetical protein